MSENSHNMIKGRVAETIIQELFIANYYHVFNYGMERTLPGILSTIKMSNDAVSSAIRSQPDFVIQDRSTGDLLYVEVKYRASGHFSIDDLIDDYPYKNAHFVIVLQSKIQAIHYSELTKGFSLSPAHESSILNYPFFKVSKKSVIEFEGYIADFYGKH